MAFNGVQWSDGGLAEQWPVANHESFRHRQWVLDYELRPRKLLLPNVAATVLGLDLLARSSSKSHWQIYW